MIIRVYFLKDPPQGSPGDFGYESADKKYRDCSATSSLLKFPNVVSDNSTFKYLLRGSIFQDWFIRGAFNQSRFPIFHSSDALRLAILKREGGIYLDSDCLVLRSLKDLRNSAGMKHGRWIENGVLAFDPHHPFVSFYEQTFVSNYSSAIYEQNGPRLMTSTLQGFCNVTDFVAYTYNCRNSTITVRPAEDFFLVDFNHRQWFYDINLPKHLDDVVRKSYVSHIYENEDGVYKAFPGSLYDILAQEFCPRTYKKSIELVGYF